MSYIDDSLLKKRKNYPVETENKSLERITNQLEALEPTQTQSTSNLSQEEIEALKDLQEDQNIIIKKADKSNILVIMDKQFYKNKLVLRDHLDQSTYEKCHEKEDIRTFKELKKLVNTHKDCLTKKEIDYVTNYEWKTSNFYVQPKVNKCKILKDIITQTNNEYIKTDPPETLKARPIIAGPMSPT